MRSEILAFKKLLEERRRKVKIYASSISSKDSATFFLIREGYRRKLAIIYPSKNPLDLCTIFLSEEEGDLNGSLSYKICPCNAQNARELRRIFPYTKPAPIGLAPAIGTGDRIGMATPGHIRALRAARNAGIKVFPVLAQQSAREMKRTLRSPQEVIDDVTWAVFQEGYRDGFAADADHLKTEEDVRAAFSAGFTMYTIDPSDYVDYEADNCPLHILEEKFNQLPWGILKSSKEEMIKRYVGKSFEVKDLNGRPSLKLSFSREDLLRAAVKYSSAIAHALKLKKLLDDLFKGERYDLELSVDETDAPTKPIEHLFIALELKRLKINLQSLALRFVGRFEKAIDYIGDLEEFERTFQIHALIARNFGPYKLSIHSGSDKFSLYPIMGRIAGDIIHLKTSGTSYLESLRIVARHDPSLFREIVKFSIESFEKDKASYHVSVDPTQAPPPEKVPDERLEETYLNNNEMRQILHVTFGSILSARGENGKWIFKDRIKKTLLDREEEYYKVISMHIRKHIESLWQIKD